MSIKDLSNAWDEAAQRAMENNQQTELNHEQLSVTAGMRVRTGVAAGSGLWGLSAYQGCSDVCTDACG